MTVVFPWEYSYIGNDFKNLFLIDHQRYILISFQVIKVDWKIWEHIWIYQSIIYKNLSNEILFVMTSFLYKLIIITRLQILESNIFLIFQANSSRMIIPKKKRTKFFLVILFPSETVALSFIESAQKNLAKFTGKHLYRSLFLIKLQALPKPSRFLHFRSL